MSWIILLFQVCNIVPAGKISQVEIPFFSFGKDGEGGIHVEILGNIVAAGENFPIQHLYL